ncbi:uncharacterized protein [Clytia hemisphaerica]|uniref:uncharacterized protein n=1 Tax=Clytia hemisphaerica TaxID=252671 RepID=UPI0034D4A883
MENSEQINREKKFSRDCHQKFRCPKAWHSWALMNYESVLYYKNSDTLIAPPTPVVSSPPESPRKPQAWHSWASMNYESVLYYKNSDTPIAPPTPVVSSPPESPRKPQIDDVMVRFRTL